MNANRQETYRQSPDFERLAETQSLSEERWLVAFALTSPATAAELAAACKLPEDTVQHAIADLLAAELIQKQTMTLKEFLAKRKPVLSVVEPEPLETPETPASPAAVVPPLVTPHAAEVEAAIHSIRLGFLPAALATDSSVVVLRFGGTGFPALPHGSTQPVRPKAAKSSQGPMKLRPVIHAIETKGGGGISGQLLVYRVFLRVPFGSLYDEGITSLKLVDENSTVRNPDLKAAIVTAAREVAGVELAA